MQMLKIFSHMKTLSHFNRFSFSKQVKFTFIRRDGTKKQVTAKQGQHILQVAKQNDIELEGACEASLACSTCHIILPKNIYQKLPSPVDEQEDLLDLAFGLTPTSRLGCQVKITQLMEGCEVTLPKASRNLYVDGTKPTSH